MRFCIVGTGRCGTKLLRTMLNAHPSLFVFDETHWIPKLFEAFGTSRADVELMTSIIQRTYHITGDLVTELDDEILKALAAQLGEEATVSEYCDALGAAFAARESKEVWADKTPDYGPHLTTIQVLWPECRFIHIVRHGVDVARSMSRHPGFRWMAAAHELSWTSPSYNRYYRAIRWRRRPRIDFIDQWYWRLLRIRDEATRLAPGSYLELKFEDLITSPHDVLRDLAEFVEIPEDDQWLQTAARMIEPDRLHRTQDRTGDSLLEDRHHRLLADLGYGTAP